MSNKQQTALEWYISKITRLEFWVETKQITWKEYHKEKDKLLEQAKEMEMGQHNKTWESSKLGYTGDPFRDSVFGQVKDFGEYYQETYGGNNEQQ